MSNRTLTSTEDIYTAEELSSIQEHPVPTHIAFIPDGNRRWAKQRNQAAYHGYKAGSDNMIEIVKACRMLGIKIVTFYGLSTENLSRNSLEVQSVLWVLDSYLSNNCSLMVEKGIRLQTIGNLLRLPKHINQTIEKVKQATEHCNGIEVILALNYGGRDELTRTVHSIINEYALNKLKKEEITESLIAKHLDTAPWPDPDILIRAGGEQRLSNFLLWQTSYSEIYTTKELWPDFTPQILFKAVLEFQKRERRLGI